jgi:hypothetical protein
MPLCAYGVAVGTLVRFYRDRPDDFGLDFGPVRIRVRRWTQSDGDNAFRALSSADSTQKRPRFQALSE